MSSADNQSEQTQILGDELLAIAAHELKSPLAVIRTLALFAADELNAADAVNDLKKIAAIAERSIEVISSLLDNERLKSGQTTLNVEPIDLVEVVHQIGAQLQPRLQERQQELRIYDRPLLPVYSDRQFIEQILYNLIDNAAKYSSESQPIDVRFGTGPRSQLVRIRDYGRGISKKDWHVLFKKFGQIKQPMSSRADTNGLGLYICKQLSEHLGGTIFLKPTRVGSCFILELPLMEQLNLWHGGRW